MNNPCPYQNAASQDKRFNSAAIIEPLIIFIAIILGFVFLGHMQMRDEKANLAAIQKEFQAKCQWHQPRQITEFDCVVINEKLAVIK